MTSRRRSLLPGSPLLRLLLVGAAVLLVGGSAVALVGGGGPGVKTYDEADEFTFSYPGSWHRVRGAAFPLAEAAGDETVGEHVVGLDLDNIVDVHATRVELVVTRDNVADLVPAARELYRRLNEANPGARTLGGPYTVVEAGMAGVRTRVAGRNARGNPVATLVTQLFGGHDSYVISCTYTPRREEAIAAGCERIMTSLRPR